MIRMPWGDAKLQKIWEKGRAVKGYDPARLRLDECSSWIDRTMHGTRERRGWQADRIVPVPKGGTDALENLRPLRWKNNQDKRDEPPRNTESPGSAGES